MATGLKKADHPSVVSLGQTHRYYKFDLTGKKYFALRIPAGAELFGVVESTGVNIMIDAVGSQVAGTTQSSLVTARSMALAAAKPLAMMPVTPGEVVRVSAANIGALSIVLEGASNIESNPASLETETEDA